MKRVVLIGGGGHARVLISALAELEVDILGIVDPALVPGEKMSGVRILGDESALKQLLPKEVTLVNAVGSSSDLTSRREVYVRLRGKGFDFMKVVHPRAFVAADAKLGEAVQVMAGALIQSNVHIGENAIVNTGSVIEHDCRIGKHVHVASGAVIAGNVIIGDSVHVGCGATVIQGAKVGNESLIGAGGVVIRDVPSKSKVAGVPAREIQ